MKICFLAFLSFFVLEFQAQAQPRVSSSKIADSIYYLAIEAGYREQFQLAIEYFDSAISIDPQIESIYFDRAIMKEYIGDTLGAILDFSEQIKKNRKDADAYFLRGKIHFELQNYRWAYQDLNRANHLDSGNADAHCLCAAAAKELKKSRQVQLKTEQCRRLNTKLQ